MKWTQMDRSHIKSDNGKYTISRAAVMEETKMVMKYRLWLLGGINNEAESLGTFNSAKDAKAEAEKCEA